MRCIDAVSCLRKSRVPVEPKPPREAVEVDVDEWLDTAGTDEPEGCIATDVEVDCGDRRDQVELPDEPHRE